MDSNIYLQNNRDDTIDLRKYINLLFRWWWLIILIGLITGGVGYLISNYMTPYYSSTSTVLVNQSPATQTTDYSSVMMSERLAKTYAELMVKGSVLQQVIEELDLQLTEDDLTEMIEVKSIINTQLIEITVETPDPNLSANIANFVVAVFTNQIEEIQGSRFAESKQSLLTQLADLETQIADIENQIDRIVVPDEKDKLEEKATQYRAIYSNLLQSFEEVRLAEAQSVSSIVQVEAAVPDPEPVRPRTMVNTVVAALLGGLLVIGVIFVREAFDDTIRSTELIYKDFHLPILGTIVRHNHKKEGSLIALEEPRSPVVEAYRAIRTSINYASVDKPLRSIMVTSMDPGEGKTTTLGNLAVVFAQTGKKVLVVDCDLRKPRIHKVFGVSNSYGLSNILAQTVEIPLEQGMQHTKIENLKILTSGPLPPNPAEWLGSKKMKKILERMAEYADIVIIDTPPSLAVTDAAVLAPQTDGVVLIARAGQTRKDALKDTIDQLRSANANILGVVLNDLDVSRSAYAYRYGRKSKYAAYNEYYGAGDKKKKSFISFF